jgi:hypothetical protein
LRDTDHKGGALRTLLLVDTGEKFVNDRSDQKEPE